MNYVKRSAEEILAKYEKLFKVILVIGSRQVGKTTLLKNKKDNIRLCYF